MCTPLSPPPFLYPIVFTDSLTVGYIERYKAFLGFPTRGRGFLVSTENENHGIPDTIFCEVNQANQINSFQASVAFRTISSHSSSDFTGPSVVSVSFRTNHSECPSNSVAANSVAFDGQSMGDEDEV